MCDVTATLLTVRWQPSQAGTHWHAYRLHDSPRSLCRRFEILGRRAPRVPLGMPCTYCLFRLVDGRGLTMGWPKAAGSYAAQFAVEVTADAREFIEAFGGDEDPEEVARTSRALLEVRLALMAWRDSPGSQEAAAELEEAVAAVYDTPEKVEGWSPFVNGGDSWHACRTTLTSWCGLHGMVFVSPVQNPGGQHLCGECLYRLRRGVPDRPRQTHPDVYSSPQRRRRSHIIRLLGTMERDLAKLYPQQLTIHPVAFSRLRTRLEEAYDALLAACIIWESEPTGVALVDVEDAMRVLDAAWKAAADA